jgi:hypothetical protein
MNWNCSASHPQTSILSADLAAAACADRKVKRCQFREALSAREWAAEFLRRCGEEDKRQTGGPAAVGLPFYAPLDVRLPVDDTPCKALVGRALDAIPVFPLNHIARVYRASVQYVTKDGHA